jgi:hypothetical protein
MQTRIILAQLQRLAPDVFAWLAACRGGPVQRYRRYSAIPWRRR